MMIRNANRSSVSEKNGNRKHSTSIKRNSIHVQKECPKLLSQNDDEAEILQRRMQQTKTLSSLSNSSNEDQITRRASFGLLAHLSGTELTEQYNYCIKMSTENKINAKNAFGLQMIDFMTMMMNKQDPDMNNLQTASRSLDVSTKIYSYRVDGIYNDALKMVGGLGKSESSVGESDNPEISIENMEVQKTNKLKNKRQKQILSSLETLNSAVELTNLSSMHDNNDSQTSDSLYLVSLPIHANQQYQMHLLLDVLLESAQDSSQMIDKDQKVPFVCNTDLEHSEICSSFSNFQFLDCLEDHEAEPHTKDICHSNVRQSKKHMSIVDDNNDGDENYNFDFGGNEENIEPEENMDLEENLPVKSHSVEIQRSVLSSTNKSNEYSYFQKGMTIHWAGPRHWKPRSLLTSESNSKVVGACRQDPNQKRKELVLEYTDEVIDTIEPKFLTKRMSRLTVKTIHEHWDERTITLHKDVHYDMKNITRFYHLSCMYNNALQRDDINATLPQDIVINYDYDNENDTQNYCPDVMVEHNGSGDNEIFTQGFTGENLVSAPKQVSKTSIPFSTHAKKVDMRQLKLNIWRHLNDLKTNEKSDGSPTTNIPTKDGKTDVGAGQQFSGVYEQIKNTLRVEYVEELTPALAFVSLLHLANEKSIKINSKSDMSDLIVLLE